MMAVTLSTSEESQITVTVVKTVLTTVVVISTISVDTADTELVPGKAELEYEVEVIFPVPELPQ